MSSREDRDTDTATGGRAWRWIVLIGLVLPLVAATVLVWATTGREQNLDQVPVAVVNNDEIISTPQPMAAGRALAAALTEPTSGDAGLDWTLANTQDAKVGLQGGKYYAVLTIPKDFSTSILSTGTDDPSRGKVQLVSNGAASTTVPYISKAVASAAADSLGQQSTQSYLGQVYDGFNQIASSTKDAASGGDQLAQGTQQVSDGAEQVDAGAAQLSAGLGELTTGAEELAAGTGSLARGADDLARGARGLSAGTADLAGGARGLARGAGQLATSSGELAGRAEELARSEADYARAARKAAAGSALVAEASRLLSLGSRAVAANVRVLSRGCERQGGSRRFCRRLGRASDRAARVAQGSVEVSSLTGDVARGDKRLAADAGRLAAGARALAAGADQLSAGAGETAAGARSLSGAAEEVAAGARDVSSGAASVAQGATQTDRAAGQLSAGAASSAGAGAELASGAASLDEGASSANSGAQQLSQGLDKLAAQSPTYSKQEKKALENVVSEPVALASSVEHTTNANGWLVGVVLGIILWLGALLGVLRRNLAQVLRSASTPISSRRLTQRQLRPATGLAIIQGAAVLVALPLLGVGVSSPLSLSLLTILAAVTFTLVGLALRWTLGGAGLIAFVLLLLLQAAALGNVLPIETAPEPLPTLNRALPLTAFVDGASQLVSGGSVGSLAGVVTVLVVWAVGSSLAALMVVRRRRVKPAPAVAVA